MKNKLFVFWGVVIAMMIVASCQREVKRHPCRLFIYGSYMKVYQIDFNGKDSIQTICGDFKSDSHVKDGNYKFTLSFFMYIYAEG